MRLRTRFGVVIPPWRKPSTAQYLNLEFVLTGKIPSKKNRQRATFNYTWVINQVKYFFQARQEVGKKDALKFIVSLIRNIKPYIFKPTEIAKWEEEAIQVLCAQAAEWAETYKRYDLSFPLSRCSVSIRHYWADEYQRDNTNRAETIHDVLVMAGIIVDDNYKCLHKNSSEADCFKDEILSHITTINITLTVDNL